VRDITEPFAGNTDVRLAQLSGRTPRPFP
jgi:hypothetical protein